MISDDELRTAMAAAMSGFVEVVAAVEPQHWDRPTPCTEWSVVDIVDHVVAGDRFTAATLGGASISEAMDAHVGLDPQDPDVIRQVTDAAGEAIAAFGGSLDRMVEHRVGRVPARRVLGFRIIDQLGHTWDIATAIGRAPALDGDALAMGILIAQAERDTLDRSPNFATPRAGGDPGDPLDTFLGAIGRTR